MVRLIAFLFLWTIAWLSPISKAEVKLPRLISDGVVLQRNTKVKVWGWSAPDEQIIIQFKGKDYASKGSKRGEWFTYLDAMEAGGPFTMVVKGNNQISINNILIGDVWVCSGQSNMELPMKRVKEKYPDAIAKSKNPSIRHFGVTTHYNFQYPDTNISVGSWMEADPENTGSFSAVGYFFAKSLYAKFHVPIGLIRASVGGSPVEAWLSEDALKAFPEKLEVAMKWKDSLVLKQVQQKEGENQSNWYKNIWMNDLGNHDKIKWQEINLDDSKWPTMNIPGYWEDQGLKDVDGVVWFRKNVQVPSSMLSENCTLFLGCITDCDSVYINGKFVGTTGYQYPPRRYVIPPGVLKKGENTIVIRVINTSGRGGFYLDKPYKIQGEKETVDLKGKWKFKLGYKSDPLPGSTVFHLQPLSLFNGMIAPLLNHSIKGVIWYQGESNTKNAKAYEKMLPAMIQDWRQKWNMGNFPFLYVQLANLNEAPIQPGESEWAELREAQLKTLSVPNTCMAVAMDLGEWNDIHPLNKEDVGKRLALCAFNIAYGDSSIVASGPMFQSYKVEGSKIILYFNNIGRGLQTKENALLQGFVIAGEDKKFYNAEGHIEGNQVIISNKFVANPKYFRYAWADNPASANLYNIEGLPASAFRNDE